MPEGDTIHYLASRIRPVLAGHVPDAIATPHPRFGRDRWPERLAGRAVTSVDAHGKHLFLRFEGGLVIHSHLRMTGAWRVRAARPAGAGDDLAGAAARRPRGAAAQGPGAGADDRVAHALRPAAGRASARTSSPTSSTRPRSCAGCARTIRRAGSATRCSTSARSPGSGTCGRSRAASRPRSIRGGRRARSATTRRWRSCASAARGCRSRRATAARTAGGGSTTPPAGRARAAGRRRS